MFKYVRAYRDMKKIREYMTTYHSKWYFDGESIAVNTVMAFDAIRAQLKDKEDELQRLRLRIAVYEKTEREFRGPAFVRKPDAPKPPWPDTYPSRDDDPVHPEPTGN